MSTSTTAPPPRSAMAPRISVVVPTYQRVDRLERVLTGLARQTVGVASFEVIVVSDGSTDGTDEYLGRDDLPIPVVAVQQSNSGPGAARNRGVAYARSDLVLFLDDDVVPAPNLVAEHLDAHERQSGRVVIGPMLTPDDHQMSPWVAWEQSMLYKQYAAMNAGKYDATPRQFYTGNASLLREQMDACGGFDETLRRAEDVELAYRLADHGVGFHFQDSARGYHYAQRSFDSWDANAYSYGRNDAAFARQPGREWMAPFMAYSFRRHNFLVRWCTRGALNSKRTRRLILSALRKIVLGQHRAVRSLVRPALSIIYSIRFHEGVADELGGPKGFRRLRKTKRIPGAPDPTGFVVSDDAAAHARPKAG